jgi:glyoxylase-like metal-dependent hydrolase (beta-lactamase superfamily II)
MKRVLVIVGLVVLLLVLAVGAAVGSAFMGRQAITDGLEVGGVRIVKDGIVSVAVVPAGAGNVALIDAGNDKTGQAILAELARRQLTSDAVVAILLTHGHPDHTGAIGVFKNAQVMALAEDVGLVEGTARAHGPLTQLFPASPTGVKVTRPLQDGETITIGEAQVRVYAVPGHTQGSAAYLVNGLLLLGDAADAEPDGKLRGSPWVFSDSQAQDRDSLVRLEQRLRQEGADVKAMAFAHSGVRTEGLAPLSAFAASAPR